MADGTSAGAVQRDEIEKKLADRDGAYQRLRRIMDAWNALWFWPLTETLTGGVQPPTIDEWIGGLTAVLGTHFEGKRASVAQGAVTLAPTTSWSDLGLAEESDLSFSGVLSINEALRTFPWLGVSGRIAKQQGFFHWEFDFATVFARGGFDLQVGNPPWVRPDWDESAALAEFDVWWALTEKPSVSDATRHREAVLAQPDGRTFYLETLVDIVAVRASVSSSTIYPHLAGLRPDLYRCFMEQTWRHGSQRGSIGLIHPETHFTDEKAGFLRAATYARLRRHWQFVNELSLFEIHHLVSYGVHIYGASGELGFEMATSLYHPSTVERSYAHDGSGEEPGLKDPDGNWDVRAHRYRIITVDDEVLRTWHAVLEDDTVPLQQARMVYAVNRATAAVLAKLSSVPRLGSLPLEFSQGWNETTDFNNGNILKRWGVVTSWNEAVLQGPHLFVANPFYKFPNETMLNNLDWSAIDLETLAPDALPITAYKPATNEAKYDAGYTHWGPNRVPARDCYRVAWRNMAANTGERTLIPAIIPPGAAHVDGIFSLGAPSRSASDLLLFGAFMGSLLVDFIVRVAPKSTIRSGTANRLPVILNHPLRRELILRAMRLQASTSAFSTLWDAAMPYTSSNDHWVGGLEFAGRGPLAPAVENWTQTALLRRASDRRQALVEIDAIVALMLDITADELCTIYRTQFAVLYGYDRNSYYYDANGRLVPNSVLTIWRKNGDRSSVEDRTATNASGNTYTYELPFVTLDREADMRQAYSHFERVLAGRS
jgi:hypothetical protein